MIVRAYFKAKMRFKTTFRTFREKLVLPRAAVWRGLISFWLMAIQVTSANAVWADESNNAYQLGRGYTAGNSGLHLGGYASLHGESFGHSPASLNLSYLSLFVTWDNNSKLRFFSELEIENGLSVAEHRSLGSENTNFRVERFHLHYLINDNLNLRIGKVLTPIGQWNLIHVDPLVWTTTRPVATENLFSEHATGIMLSGTVLFEEQSLDYSVYADYSSSLDLSKEPPRFDNAMGLRLRYNVSDNLQLGASYADFALADSPAIRNHLIGLDFAWSYQRFAINSEIVYRKNEATINQNAWQGYIQGVSPLTSHLYAVGRYEFFDQPSEKLGQAGVLGFAFRPSPPLALKLEYRLGKQNRDLAPNGLFASFSVLF